MHEKCRNFSIQYYFFLFGKHKMDIHLRKYMLLLYIMEYEIWKPER